MNPEQLAFVKEASQRRLINYCELINPKWETIWFHELIAEKLQSAIERLKKGEKVRIILSIPPRHGKSQLASIYFPAWALGKYPDLKFILSTYGAELSEKMGLQTRDVINSDVYKMIFPGIELRQDQKAKAKWMTNKGGSYTAVGIGGAVTGIGADCIILDDPHKSREEAESETVRETVYEYYRSTLYSRLEGFGAVIIIMQRWHTDDLVGRLIEDEKKKKEEGSKDYDEWEIINFPAIAEEDEYINGKLIRKEGDVLWPSKFPVSVLNNIRETAGIYNFSSQYQQQPISSATQEFKEHMFRYFNEEDLKGKYLRYYTLVDPAISQAKNADNSVVLTVAKEVNGPNIYRIREDAGHYTPQELIDLIFLHQNEYGSRVFVEAVQYQQAIKYALLEQQRKLQKYFLINEIKSKTKQSKELRIRGLLPFYATGVIYHRKKDVEYEKELLTFPKGKHDDRIDTMSFIQDALDPTYDNQYAKQTRSKFRSYFSKRD